MSLETRTNSALFKRAEQLKRWMESDTNREPVSPKHKSRKIKFSSGCVFLAACAAGDKDEVLKLLQNGADIDTSNVDGLTALHQACIDDNLDMVEFLVENGADVNRGDNEGWTPLHATASCGFLSIAKYLIEQAADVAAVNNDGELALDIAECHKMEDLLREEIERRGIDCEAARNEEEMIMLRDAKDWLASKSPSVNVPHPKNGATPLHVASAKGYMEVINLLLQCGADIDAQDVDGWSPLHAAAHWGQKEVCKVLTESLADMELKNYVGQTAFDLCDNDMLSYLEELKKKQNKEEVFNRRMAKKRPDVGDRNLESETPNKVKKVEQSNEEEPKISESTDMDVAHKSETESESSSETETASSEDDDDEAQNKLNSSIVEKNNATPIITRKIVDDLEDNPPWRKFKEPSELSSPTKSISDSTNFTKTPELNDDNDVTIRKKANSQNDKGTSKEDDNEGASITVNVDKTRPATSPPPPTSPPPTSQQPLRSGLKLNIEPCKPSAPSAPTTNSATTLAANSATTTTPATNSATTPTSPGGTRLQMLKNFFKSFVPPVRDEESETQRKAHAKRVRETRRSTQGVTLEEIKSAEQLVKKKNQSNNDNNTEKTNEPGSNGQSSNGVIVTATITTGTPTVITRETEEPPAVHERRPSWRLRVDNGTSKFKLEDATRPTTLPSTPSYVRRTTNANATPVQRPSSAPLDTAETTVTLPLRKPKSTEEKDQDKENDIRNAQSTLATQAAIQRRRRPKRRSTGVVSFDNIDDPDQEKDPTDGKDCDDTIKANHLERPCISSTAPVTVTCHETALGSSYTSRPKSLGHYPNYSSPYTSSTSNGAYSSFGAYNGYGSNYQSPYFPNGYRGNPSGAAGYASLKIPAKALLGLAGVKKYDADSRGDLSRGGSYRERSASRSRSSLAGLGSRSISLTSLNSEGYGSGTDRSRSRIGSTSDIRNENGELDYKKLYEKQLVENDRLKEKLRKSDEELRETKQTLEKISLVTSKNSLSELEKRERRAMERKLSEMEEELKNLENLKSENQRLKDENGALIRVISKLSK